jgi:hypothetical protein
MILEKGMGGLSATDPVKTSVKYRGRVTLPL